ncbi:MAG: DUF2325 domain-containing protein [Polaromonas sp.]|nr:MAG: DUF2325 domain-containing protein [Polaromonas sp.]
MPHSRCNATTCPAPLAAIAKCYKGQDGVGAFYWIAIPTQWNQVLVVHAHGGPELGAPRAERTEEDLKRWAVTVKAGYAWVGSTYRRGGYGVTVAAEDTERVRQIFVQHVGQPRRTLLHGQSYGGGVASKAIELFATSHTSHNGKSPYDGVLLTSAVLGGGAVAYNFRLDLRVVYQYICQNHPKADEPAYPLWMGLPKGATLSRAELAQRVDDCTGLRLPPAQRSAAQQQRLSDILNVVKIPERSLLGHLNWATWLFEDLVQHRLQGRNPFENEAVVYKGSSNDAALNQGVLRYAADPAAVALLAADSQPTGRLPVPTLTLHATHDPTAFVELESNYRDVVERVGGKFAHHDGGVEDNASVLDANLAAADLVICQTGCISHNAYWRVKDFCKRTGKRCVFVENPSASSLERGLAQIAIPKPAPDVLMPDCLL